MLQILNYYNDFQRDYDERVADIRTFGYTFIREWPMYGHSTILLYASGRCTDIQTHFCTRVADNGTFRLTFVREWPIMGHSDSFLYASGHKSDIRVLLKHSLNIKKRAIT